MALMWFMSMTLLSSMVALTWDVGICFIFSVLRHWASSSSFLMQRTGETERKQKMWMRERDDNLGNDDNLLLLRDSEVPRSNGGGEESCVGALQLCYLSFLISQQRSVDLLFSREEERKKKEDMPVHVVKRRRNREVCEEDHGGDSVES